MTSVVTNRLLCMKRGLTYCLPYPVKATAIPTDMLLSACVQPSSTIRIKAAKLDKSTVMISPCKGLGFVMGAFLQRVYSALSLRSEQMSATLQKAHHQNCGPTVFKTAEQRPNSLALPLGHPMETQRFQGRISASISHSNWPELLAGSLEGRTTTHEHVPKCPAHAST